MIIITLSKQQEISDDRSERDLIKLRDIYGYTSVRYYPYSEGSCKKCQKLKRKRTFSLDDFLNLRGLPLDNDEFRNAPFFSWTHPQVNIRSILVVSGENLPDIYVNYRGILNPSKLRNMDRLKRKEETDEAVPVKVDNKRDLGLKSRALGDKLKSRRNEDDFY